ncbi:MAG: sodium:calcium antiporter, partial [Candidatus Limnocylindrales bacterium]
MEIAILVAAFVVILLGAELFTNGIEWFGRKLELAEGAVGSVLAAVGTALPETMIPIIAILSGGGSSSSHGIGVGAILGAPFMLSTLAMFVTGIAVVYAGRKRPTGDVMPVDTKVLAHDMRYFAIAYAIAIGAAFLPLDPAWPKWVVAVVLIAIYGWYVKGHFEDDPSVDLDDLAPLRFNRLDPATPNGESVVPRLRVVNLQVLAALGLIIIGAFFFVDAVEHLSSSFGIAPIIVALVIAPIATELPEKFNSVIWVRQGKDTLAMGNITGA